MKQNRSNPLFARFFRANSIVSAVVMTLAGVAVQPFAFAADQNYVGPNASKVWNTTTTNWDSGAVWTNGNNAIFSGTGESVTVTTATANGITFSSAGFTLTAGTLTLGAAATPIVATADATIASIVAGTSLGLSKSGAGVLTLSGVNTYTGATAITAGTLKLGNAAGLGASSLTTVSAGATLDVAGFAAASRPITIAGTGVSGTALYNSSIAAGPTPAALTLSADATLGGASNVDAAGFAPSSLDLAGKTLTIASGRLKMGTNNITSGNIAVSSGAVFYPSGSTTQVGGTGTITLSGSAIMDVRDYNNTAWTNRHGITVDGGTISNGGAAAASPSNGGGAQSTIGNNITINAGGGTLNPNNTGFGLNLRFTGTLSGAGALTINGGRSVEWYGDVSGYTGNVTISSSLPLIFIGTANQIFNGALAGAGAVTKNAATTATLAGNNSYTGTTTVSAGTLTLSGTNTTTGATVVSAGTTLALNYATNDNRKIGAGALTLSGGTIQLASGTFADSVTTTTLTAGTVSSLTRSSGSATLNLGAVTAGSGAVLTIPQSGIAKTTNPNNAGGTLGSWAVIGGTDWGMNDGTGNIVSYTGYSLVTRLSSGPQTITDGSATNVQIIEGTGAAAPILLGSATTSVNSLNQSASGGTSAAIIDPAGQTLVVNSVMIGTGAGALTFGTGTNNGTLKSSGTALGFRDLAGAGTTVNSVIADGTGASSLSKDDLGALTLTAANTYTGGTTIVGGSLLLTGAGSLAAVSTVDLTYSGTSFNLAGISASGATVGSINGVSGTTIVLGSKNLTAGGSANTSFAGIISGSGASLTKTGSGSLTLSGANTYSGNTALNAGTLVMGNKNALGAFQTGSPVTQVTVASGATVNFNGVADATYGYTIAGAGVGSAGALLNNGAAIGTGSAQTTNIKLAANATVGGSGSWCLLASAYGATSLDLGGYTLTKVGAGTFSLCNSTVTAGTFTVAAGVLATTTTAPNTSAVALTLNNTAGVSLTLATAMSVGSLTGGGATGGGVALAANTLTIGALNTNTTYAGAITGTGVVVKNGSGTLTLSGANTYSGATTVSGGTLALDYSITSVSKLSDTAALNFNGYSGLSLNGGSHTEIVASTTLNAGANVYISRPSGTGILQMKAITRNTGATINFASPSIATTDTLNTNGILGGWAMIGNDFACNSTNAASGLITAYSGYTDVTRTETGTKVIADAATSNIRITEGTGSTFANITLAAATTNINTLLQSTVGGASAATVALPSQTLRFGPRGAILSSSGAGNLTIGSVVGEGTLMPGQNVNSIASDLTVTNNSSGVITINSLIANEPVPASRTGSTTTASAIVTGLSATTDLVVGMTVTGTGLAANSTIASIQSATQITLNANVTTGAAGTSLTFGVSPSGFAKAGTGDVILTGASTYTGTTSVTAGSLEVRAKNGDVGYIVNHGATLRFGYSTGGGYSNTPMTMYGDGVSATSGVYLLGGTSYNVGSGFVINDAPTTIRQYGSGVATIGIFDTNSNPGLSTTAAASGSVVDSNIQFVSRGYGMVVTTVVGANSATGDLVMNGPLNVAGTGLFKRGAGSLALNAAAISTNGGLQLQAGTVITGATNAIGTNAVVSISAGAKLVVNGTSQTLPSIANSGSVTGGAAALSTLNVSGTAASTSAGTLGGSGTNDNNLALAKAGTGMLTLTGNTSTYAGGSTVNGGTLRISNTAGSATGSGGVTVNSAGTLDGAGTISGVVTVGVSGGTISPGLVNVGALNVGGLTFAGTGTLVVSPGASSVNVTGSNGLTTSGATGSVAINIGTTPLAAGTYHLISHVGGIQGTGLGAFVLSTTPGGAYSYTLQDNAGYLDLRVSTSAIFWSGSLSSDWSTLPAALNWLAGASPSYFSTGNQVVFDDTASNTTVTVAMAGVAPGAVQFTNSTNEYTLGGGAVTGSTGLLKGGTGLLIISNTNSFTGAVTVSQGTLQVGTIGNVGMNSALGAGTSIVLSGGTLSYAGSAASTDRTVTVSTTGSLEVASGPLTLTGVISGAGALTKTGYDPLILNNLGNTIASIVINQGAVSVDDMAKLGTGTLAMGGGTLDVVGSTALTTAKALALRSGGGTIQVDDTAGLTWSTGITGTGGMHKTGAGTLTFSGNMNFSGGVIVDEGTLLIGGGGWYVNPFGQTNLITINAGGKVQTAIVHGLGTDSNTVFVNGGTLQIASGQYVSSLHMAGGLVTGGNLSTFGGTMTFDASTTGSTIASPLNCYPATAAATLQVADGDAATDLLLSGVVSNVGNLIKTGLGTLDLSAANTYVGNTTVNAGTLHLTSTGRLTFAIGATSGLANKITGTGAVIVDGAFVIDTSAATALNTGTWLLNSIATLSVTYGGTFSVMNTDGSLWTDSGTGKWSKAVGTKTWTFDKASGTLTVLGNGYAGWAATHAGGGTPTQDFDGDGVSNGLEWVLGGSETTNDLGKLPKATTAAGNLEFTFVRDQQILTDAGTTVEIEVGTNLAGWTDTYTVGVDTAGSSASPGATGTVTVTANTPVAGKDTVTLTVTQAPDATKFARMKVLITP